MSKPSNPFEVVLKNKFFPEGLTEQDIYSYWMKNKIELLTELRDKRSLFYLSDKNQKVIVRRYVTSDKPIKLTDLNYDKIITGRTVGLLEVFEPKSKFGVVDIDSPKSDEDISSESSFNMVKDLTAAVFNYMSRMHKCTILYTGKNGFHVRVEFERKMDMDKLKKILEDQITSADSLKDYYQKRNDTYPNIDLSPNMRNGAVIIPRSLNKIGLPAVELSVNRIREFRREDLVGEVIRK